MDTAEYTSHVESPLADPNWDHSPVPERDKEKNRERITDELRGVSLVELSAAPEMIDCAKRAMDLNLGSVEFPPELELMRGVRIDDCGMVDPSSQNDEARLYGFSGAFRRTRTSTDMAEQVGEYSMNNGTLNYTDELGRQWMAPMSEPLLNALRTAGYRQNEKRWVHGSNGQYPADPERAETLLRARAVSGQLEILEKLKVLGIDKTDEAGSLLEATLDPKSTVSRQIADQMLAIRKAINEVNNELEAMRNTGQSAMREERQEAMRKQLQSEGALPVEENPEGGATDPYNVL